MKRALIIWGGWKGHQPQLVSEKIEEELVKRNYNTYSTNDFAILLNENLLEYDVIIPIWSCGIKSNIYLNQLLEAVKAGVGLATFHGGINWFDQDKYYEMIGASYLYDSKPEKYSVILADSKHPITEGIDNFEITSEIYFMQVDPLNKMLAYTELLGSKTPIAWTKKYGKGSVFYTTLAHDLEAIFNTNNIEMIMNGIDWVSNLNEHD